MPTKNQKLKRARRTLRKFGYLPPYGEPLNEKQQKIWDDLNGGDYSILHELDIFKKYPKKEHNCIDCGETDPTKFYKNGKGRCKKCYSHISKEKYKNGELLESIQKNKIWRINNLIRVRLNAAKSRAKIKKFEFELTEEILFKKIEEQNNRCFFSGIELTQTLHDWHCLSLDRLDTNIGYTIKNTILVTRFVNIAKNSLSKDDFVNEIKLCYSGMVEKQL